MIIKLKTKLRIILTVILSVLTVSSAIIIGTYDIRELWLIVLYIIVILCCIALFLLNIEDIGKNNKQARVLTFYVIGCYVTGVISMTIGALAYPQKSDTLGWLVGVFFPFVAICCLMARYLATKSNTSYYLSYLIPKWTIQTFSIDSEFKKRLLLIVLFYPLFTLVPLPVAGLLVLVYYILPVIVLLFAIWGFVWIIAWLKAGKALDLKIETEQTDKACIFCKHCGKQIDAGSVFCRYCGKSLLDIPNKNIEENLSTEVTEEDLANVWTDEYGVKYSKDRKKLLKAPEILRNYSVINGTRVICNNAFQNYDYYGEPTSALESIDIPNSVKAIGDHSFTGCSKLSSIKLYDGIENIGTGAFRDCTSIEKITLPKSLRKLGDGAFGNCINLNVVVIDCLLKSVPYGVFSGCLNLRNVDLPISIEEIDNYAFYDCENLESISFPPKIKEIGDFAFKGCESLTSISIPKGVTYIGGSAFSYCTSLIQVSLPNSITDFGNMYENGKKVSYSLTATTFEGCEILESIYIPLGEIERFEKLLSKYKDKLVEQEKGWLRNFTNVIALKSKLIEMKTQLLPKSLGILISTDFIAELKKELINWELEEVVHFYCDYKIKHLFDDIASVTATEIVDSDYGYSVCFFTKKGGKIYVPLSEKSALLHGDTLDMNTAKIIIDFSKGKDLICKIVE